MAPEDEPKKSTDSADCVTSDSVGNDGELTGTGGREPTRKKREGVLNELASQVRNLNTRC